MIRIGRNGPFFQRGEGGPGNTASVPDDIPPADLTREIVLELFEKKAAGPEAVAVDPTTGQCVFHKKGRFGDYLEVALTPEQEEAKVPPKRVTMPPGTKAEDLTDGDVAALLSFPRELGQHPETAATVVLSIGRYGAYLVAGDQKGNVGDWREAAKMDLAQALVALAASGRGGAGKAAEPIKEFGKLEGAAGVVKVMSGRYGPYVTDGKVNATLPKGIDPATVTAEKALELINAKIAAGPSKKPFKRRAKAK